MASRWRIYVLGSTGEEDDTAKSIAHKVDITVCSVQYRLAPEYPFPAAINDAYSVLQWMTSDQGVLSLGIDVDRIAIGGPSAGGGLSAGVSLMARDKGGPKLCFQLLLYPMIDNMHDTVSGQLENTPAWNKETSHNAWEMYLNGNPGKKAPAYAAAARADDLTGLLPAYICVGTDDLFRDEDIEYARRLMAANVPCELAVFPGVYHGADMDVPGARVCQRLEQSYLAALRDALRTTDLTPSGNSSLT